MPTPRSKSLLTHLAAFASFLVVAMIFCKPAMQGMVLRQDDNIQWRAMYEDQRRVKEQTGNQPLWTKQMFSGMPAYQISLEAPNPISFQHLYSLFTSILPKPVHFFVLACLSFYFLALAFQANPFVGILGGLAYAYATYHPVIIGAGHDTKMVSLALMPMLVGAIHLIFQRRYLIGTALSAVAASLLIGANHPQISYYTILILGAMTLAELVYAFRAKDYRHMATSLALAVSAGLLGVACNAVLLATTYEYSKESIRGGSMLADKQSPNDQNGLNKEYALSYSIYKTEPLVMMFPRIYGGSTGNLEVSEDKSKAIEALQQMPPELGQQLQSYLQFYWGGISQGTSGPPYAGAIISFLALLALTVLPNRHKYWMVPVTLFAFALSWGHYFEGFNVFMLEHLPFYNKFRAPSMVMVIPTLLFALAAVMALQELLFVEVSPTSMKQYRKGLYVVAGVFIVALAVYFSSNFTSETDKSLLEQVKQIPDASQRDVILRHVQDFQQGLREDRKSLFTGDLLRSLLLAGVAGLAIWLRLRGVIKGSVALASIGLLMLMDIFPIDVEYLNESNYVEEEGIAEVFTPAPYNLEIAKDTGSYRVLDLSRGVSAAFNGNALTAVFHRSIGGYHAAKLSIYQDLIEKQLYKYPDCQPTLDMLNTRYVIFNDPATNQITFRYNPSAAGDCWFVASVRTERQVQKVMGALDSLHVLSEAIVEADLGQQITKTAGDSIWLQRNNHDEIQYHARSAGGGFAVFSEVYYKPGWEAYIDGEKATIYKTNYVLRGLYVPAGEHDIRFEFKPDTYYGSMKVGIAASAVVWLLLGSSAAHAWRRQRSQKGSS